MKKLLVLPLLILLSGCVTYYYPETALEDGVYYAEDDPSYIFNSGDYSGVVYYPWSSLDYFYLGYRPYTGYGFVYYSPFGWPYSPWGNPYAYNSYYSPWYFSHYQTSYWRPYSGSCSHHGSCRKNSRGDKVGEPVRYAGVDQLNSRNHDGRNRLDEDDIRGREKNIGNNAKPPMRRYIFISPTGDSGNQGRVVRSREDSKIGKNQLEPVDSVPVRQSSERPSAPNTVFHPPVTSTPDTFSGSTMRSPPASSRSTRSSQPTFSSSRSSRQKDRD